MATNDPVFRVSADGITAPSYEEIIEYYKDRAREIFGSDINLDADTQDGQLLAIFAAALHDVNSQAVATYNSFNPTTAIGAALDSAVKTNGITRRAASRSQVDVRIIGQAGTTIRNGVVIDTQDCKWDLPEEVLIPLSGEIVVTAEAQTEGAIAAAANSLTKIGTPTLGWQSVTNPAAAVPGIAVESDAELRTRQTLSTMQPTIGLWDGLISSIAQLDGVHDVAGRHNDMGEVSDEGIPAHSIAVVVSGGDVNEIAKTIFNKKSQGVATYGTTSTDCADSAGTTYSIKFSRPTDVPITISMRVKAREMWNSTVETEIKDRLAEYVNGLPIGGTVDAAKCAAIIVQRDSGLDETFFLKEITLNGKADTTSLKWYQKASCKSADISITVE